MLVILALPAGRGGGTVLEACLSASVFSGRESDPEHWPKTLV